MNTNLSLRALAVAAVLTAGLGTAATAVAQDGSPQSAPTAARSAADTTSERTPTSVVHQSGIVIEAHGEHVGSPVAVYLYENSVHGNSLQVVLDPEQDVIGFVEQQTPFVVDGTVDVTVDVQGRSVVLSGTVADSGEAAKEVDPRQDGGEQIITRGTQTRLLADLSLTVEGVDVPLEAAPAFAYDLEVRKVTLYGR